MKIKKKKLFHLFRQEITEVIKEEIPINNITVEKDDPIIETKTEFVEKEETNNTNKFITDDQFFDDFFNEDE